MLYLLWMIIYNTDFIFIGHTGQVESFKEYGIHMFPFSPKPVYKMFVS